jgi:hypothetical protein
MAAWTLLKSALGECRGMNGFNLVLLFVGCFGFDEISRARPVLATGSKIFRKLFQRVRFCCQVCRQALRCRSRA